MGVTQIFEKMFRMLQTHRRVHGERGTTSKLFSTLSLPPTLPSHYIWNFFNPLTYCLWDFYFLQFLDFSFSFPKPNHTPYLYYSWFIEVIFYWIVDNSLKIKEKYIYFVGRLIYNVCVLYSSSVVIFKQGKLLCKFFVCLFCF